LGDAEELRALIAGAGFSEVQIRPVRFTRHLVPLEEVVWGHLAAIDEAARAALLRDFRKALQSYQSGGRLVIPAEALFAMAQTAG
jgi:hypothetical protein